MVEKNNNKFDLKEEVNNSPLLDWKKDESLKECSNLLDEKYDKSNMNDQKTNYDPSLSRSFNLNNFNNQNRSESDNTENKDRRQLNTVKNKDVITDASKINATLFSELVEKGDLLVKERKIEEAYNCYKEAYDKAEKCNHYSLYYKIGDTSMKLKKYVEALKFYKIAYKNSNKLSIDYPTFKYARTLMFYFDDDPNYGDDIEKEIIECLKESIDLNMKRLNEYKDNCIANFNIGCILGIFNYKESYDFFIKAEKFADEELKSKIYDEMTLVTLNEMFDLQIEYVDKAINCDKSCAYYNSHKAKLLSMQNKDVEAIAIYLESIKLDPFESKYYNRLGNIYFKANSWNEAEDCYLKAIKLNDKIEYYHNYHDYGLLLLERKEYEKALEYFRKALQIGNYQESISKILQIHGIIFSIDKESDLEIINSKLGSTKSVCILDDIEIRLKDNLNSILFIEKEQEKASELDYYNNNSNDNFNKGLLNTSLKKYEEAINEYDSLIQKEPFNINAHNNKGISLAYLGKYYDAIKCFDLAIKINPMESTGYTNKGQALKKLGKYNDAIEYFDLALKINPNDSDALNHKGNTLDNLGKYDDAIKCFNSALQINPMYLYNAYNNKGTALDKLGKHDDAIICYDLALKINPNDSKSYNNKGISFRKLGKHDDAIKCFNLALLKDPNNSKTYNNIGTCLAMLGKYNEAIEYFDSALDKLGKHYDAFESFDFDLAQVITDIYNNKVLALNRLDKYDDAIKCVDLAIKINPNDSNLYIHKGYSLNFLGKYDDAIICFELALQINPNDSNMQEFIDHNSRLLYENIGNYEQIKKINSKLISEILNEAVKCKQLGNFKFKQHKYFLAESYFKKGLYLLIKVFQQHALKINEDKEVFKEIINERINLNSDLSNCYVKLKKFKEAIEVDKHILTELDEKHVCHISYGRIINSYIELNDLVNAKKYANVLTANFDKDTVSKYNETFLLLDERKKIKVTFDDEIYINENDNSSSSISETFGSNNHEINEKLKDMENCLIQ